MNILAQKKERYTQELMLLVTARDAKIAQKVAEYKASLEAQEDEKISKLRSIISATDTLLANCSDDFEYEVVADTESADTSVEFDFENANASESSDTIEPALAECFKKKTVQRPGMNDVAIPTRH